MSSRRSAEEAESVTPAGGSDLMTNRTAGVKARVHTGKRFAYLLASLFSALFAVVFLVNSTISIVTERQSESLARQYHLSYSAHLTLPALGLVVAVVLAVISVLAGRRRML